MGAILTLDALRNRKNYKVFKHKWIDLPDLNAANEHHDGIEGRFYSTPTGVKYPSVTTFLGSFEEDSDWYDRWAKKLGGYDKAEAESNRCADRGTGVHLAIETMLRNEPNPERHAGAYVKMFRQLQYHINVHLDEVYGLEIALWSDMMRLAGRCDCVARWRGLRAIVDWKTSNSFKRSDWIEDYYLQTTAYAVMHEERTGIPIEHAVIGIAVETEERPQIIEFNPNHYKRLLATKIKAFREIQKAKSLPAPEANNLFSFFN